MFYDLFKDYREWKAETLASMTFINQGNGSFEKQQLPREWQLAPVFALTSSPDGKTITAGGNFYGVVPYEGRYDGLLVSNYRFGNKAGDAAFAGSMPSISGEVRDAKWITVKNEKMMLLARNNLPLILLKPALLK
jgi:hypothetical protein